jgi:hypothetical protein
MYCLIVFPFFSSTWRMQKIWSVIDLLRGNSHWLSPITSSMYGLNVEIWIQDKFCMKFIALISHDNCYSVAWVRVQTIPTERPPFVGEVSANFFRYRVKRGQRDGSLRQNSRFSGPEPLLFLSSGSSIVLTMLSGPSSRLTTSQKVW